MSDSSNVSIITGISYILAENCKVSISSLENGVFSLENDFSGEFTELHFVPLSAKLNKQAGDETAGKPDGLTLTARMAKINGANNQLTRELESDKYVFVATDFDGTVYLLGNKDLVPQFKSNVNFGDPSSFRGYEISISLAWPYGLVLAQ